MYSESQVAPAFQKRDPEAFTQVYERYHEAARDRIRGCTPRNLQSELDDICQHFWTELYRYSGSYDPARPLENWLFGICAKAPANYYRTLAKKRAVNLIGQNCLPLFGDARWSDCDDVDGDAPDTYTPHDGNPGPEECAIFKEDLEIVMAALDRIPSQFKRIIEEVYLRGFRPVDYAALNGIALGTVYTQLKRGIEHLQRALCLEPIPV